MFNLLLEQLISRNDLTKEQIIFSVDSLLNENISIAQKSALLVLLKSKGESVDEIVHFVEVFKTYMQSISIAMPLLDIVGTGGDGLKTINFSTGAALLAASCGVFVAKHGNRAVSSHCGSADILESLKIPIALPKELLTKSIENNRFGFCFAPLYHPAFKSLKPLRVSLGISTLLNLLGPFLNPANAKHYVLGVSSKLLLSKFAEVLLKLNVKKSVVVHSCGMDEISTAGITDVAEVDGKNIRYYTIDPKEFGLKHCDISELQGTSVFENMHRLMEAFQGVKGPIADNLALNAGMGLYVYGKCGSLVEGFEVAKENLKNGAVIKLIKILSRR